MAIEFTRLADVTAIEEVKEEDSVLVVQDGEVKRAPKTAVGGGGGGILTITFIFNGDWDDNPQIIGGTFEDLANAFTNNIPFIVVHMARYDDHFEWGMPRSIYYNGDNFQMSDGYCGFLVWNDDGSVSYPD